MTNKLEISRELAQKVDDLLYIMTGHDSYPRLVRKYGKEWWTPINEMRAEICTLLAAPVVERQPVAIVDESDDGLFIEFIYGENGNPLQRGTKLYTSPPAPVASENLCNFANAMIDIALEGADADGGHIQELAVKHGLLMPEQRTERCGDSCQCAEYADFPVECFRKVKELNQ